MLFLDATQAYLIADTSQDSDLPIPILPPCPETVLQLEQPRKLPGPSAPNVRTTMLPSSPQSRRVNDNSRPDSEAVVTCRCLYQTQGQTLETARARLMRSPTNHHLPPETRTSSSQSRARQRDIAKLQPIIEKRSHVSASQSG
jgi:hypothetical protein